MPQNYQFPPTFVARLAFMIEIDGKVVSLDVLDQYFSCDLSKCKGACCVEGDAGAPVLEAEKEILLAIWPKVKPHLPTDGVQAIEEQGVWVADPNDGEAVTPLVEGKHCAYTIFERGTAWCGIEKAWRAGEIDFQKPLSCHLYPIRIQRYPDFEAVNYERWHICKPACSCGAKQKTAVYAFCKSALVRAYGEEWYKKLKMAADWHSENPD